MKVKINCDLQLVLSLRAPILPLLFRYRHTRTAELGFALQANRIDEHF